ncbi:MAG: hypothetical protein ACLFPX_05475 [Candidatus Omnitrophota bacterium]
MAVLTRMFWTIAVMALAATVAVLVMPEPEVPRMVSTSPAADRQPGQAAGEGAVQKLVDFSVWEDTFSAREIFEHPFRSRDDSGRNGQQPVQAAPAEFQQRYQLRGVLIDRQPQAVIEQTADRSVIYLGEGDGIQGFEVQRIFPQKVVFSKEGRRFELSL